MKLIYKDNKESVELSLGQALCGYFMFDDCIGITFGWGILKPDKKENSFWKILADKEWKF